MKTEASPAFYTQIFGTPGWNKASGTHLLHQFVKATACKSTIGIEISD